MGWSCILPQRELQLNKEYSFCYACLWNYRDKLTRFINYNDYLVKLMPVESSEEYMLSAINTRNEVINVVVRKCHHCNENVPKVGICQDCNTEYLHTKTVENPETGFIHFIYECSKCPPDKRKAQKVIKINDGNGNTSSRDDLIKGFL